MNRKRNLAAFAAALTMLPAMAGTDIALADSSRVYDLDEVVVISQPKEQVRLRLQPLSSTVLTANEMGTLGLRDLRDVSDYVPSFTMPAYGSRYTSSMYVRGIGSRRKYNSTLAAEASAVFSLELGMAATFDCRMVPLPNVERVEDYFRWRQEDANRNALNSHCYWMLRKEGVSVHKATSELNGKGVSYKNELLFSRGINYDKLPSWQKRGVGMWMEEYEKEGTNPLSGETKMTTRKRIHVDYELPIGDEYGELIRSIIEKEGKKR